MGLPIKGPEREITNIPPPAEDPLWWPIPGAPAQEPVEAPTEEPVPVEVPA